VPLHLTTFGARNLDSANTVKKRFTNQTDIFVIIGVVLNSNTKSLLTIGGTATLAKPQHVTALVSAIISGVICLKNMKINVANVDGQRQIR
jgi:hypothetical protein